MLTLCDSPHAAHYTKSSLSHIHVNIAYCLNTMCTLVATLDLLTISYRSCAVFKIEALIWVSFRRALKSPPFSWKVGSNPRRQSKSIEMKYKTHIKLVHELYGPCVPVHCEELRINHSTPLLVVSMPYACWFLWWADYIEDFKWRLPFQFWKVAFWRVVLKEVYCEGPNHVWRALKTSILNTDRVFPTRAEDVLLRKSNH